MPLPETFQHRLGPPLARVAETAADYLRPKRPSTAAPMRSQRPGTRVLRWVCLMIPWNASSRRGSRSNRCATISATSNAVCGRLRAGSNCPRGGQVLAGVMSLLGPTLPSPPPGRYGSYQGISCRSQLSGRAGLNSATRPLLPITLIPGANHRIRIGQPRRRLRHEYQVG